MIYCVIGEDLELHISKVARPDDYITVGASEWLIRSDLSTSKAVWEHLFGADEPNPPTSVVLGVRGYYGYHEHTLWEWLSAKHQSNGD